MSSIAEQTAEVLDRGESPNDSTVRADEAITWDKSLVTGSFRIDFHHQEIFRQVNALANAVKQGKGRDLIGRLLDFLGQYVVRHFDAEEKLMDELNCPAAVANEAHAKLLSTYNSLRKQFDEAGTTWPTLVVQIHDLFSLWLVRHINGIDMQLREYYCHAKQSFAEVGN